MATSHVQIRRVLTTTPLARQHERRLEGKLQRKPRRIPWAAFDRSAFPQRALALALDSYVKSADAEYGAVEVYAQLTSAMALAGVPLDLITASAHICTDEARHADYAMRMAELLTDADISSLHPYLSLLISQLHRLCPPDLCIVDGRIGLEGQGPILGDPVPMNSIIFSNDALAADVAACRLMMIPPEEVPHLRKVAADLARDFPEVQLPANIQPRSFAFNDSSHSAIILKFANKRLHRSSELFMNRWLDRFLRFKREPVKFATEGIPKLARRLHAR